MSLTFSFCFEQTLYRAFHRCFLPHFGSFGYSVSEKIFFRNQPIGNMNCLWWPYLLTDRDEMRTFYRCFLPSFGSFGQVVSEEKIFFKLTNQKQELTVTAMFVNESGQNEQSLKNRPIRNKNCLW